MVEHQEGATTPPGDAFAELDCGLRCQSKPRRLRPGCGWDGIANIHGYFFSTNPGVFRTGLVTGAVDGNTFAFTHPQNSTASDRITGDYRWSKNLANFHCHGQSDGDGTTVSFNNVTNGGIITGSSTVTVDPTYKLFVDVMVTPN